MEELPVPSSKTPWEEIFGFRSNPDAIGNLFGLRTFIHEMSRSNLSVVEIEDKLKTRLYRHKKYIESHMADTDLVTLRSVLSIDVDNLSTVGIVIKVLQTIFSLTPRKVKLLRAESSAPNPEVAFIVKAQETFR